MGAEMKAKRTSAWYNSYNFSQTLRKNLYGYALLFRFMFLFASACALGIFISSSLSSNNDYCHIIDDYFTAYTPTTLPVFIQNVIRSSLFDLVLLALAWCSALTFFCSTLLHLINIAFGTIYGICIGTIMQSAHISILQTLTYILYVSILAILCAMFSAKLLIINKKCLYSVRASASGGKPYISSEIQQLFQEGFKRFIYYSFIRIIFCLILTFISI